MKKPHAKYKVFGNSRGGALVLVAFMLVVLLGVAALAIDIGFLSTTKNELQDVADAAALAGAGYLGAIYKDIPPELQGTHLFTRAEIVAVVQAVALQNQASGANITINDNADIKIGMWDPATTTIATETLTGPDAVYVKARRDAQANNPISTFFAGIFGINDLPVAAEATAALSGPSTVAEGELITPFGISENWFPSPCTDLVSFSPTTSSCAAWHNFFDPINANAMADKLIGFIQGDAACKYCDVDTDGDGVVDYTLSNGPDWLEHYFNINKTPDEEVTPAATVGDDFEFQGGAIASLFNGNYLGADYDGYSNGTVYLNDKIDTNPKSPAPMIALFDYYRYRDGDGDDAVWSATIPVYKDTPGSCTNPNTNIEIVGFAKVVVISPDPPPSTNIKVHIDCNMTVVEGRGGGGTYGTVKGTVPNLVK